ncbi:hypothetical protein OKW21_000100 [Catalinimonas alkaloidigena]|nr:hypothetical protein [Catalinimonas alkaloidigena]
MKVGKIKNRIPYGNDMYSTKIVRLPEKLIQPKT